MDSVTEAKKKQAFNPYGTDELSSALPGGIKILVTIGGMQDKMHCYQWHGATGTSELNSSNTPLRCKIYKQFDMAYCFIHLPCNGKLHSWNKIYKTSL